MAVVPQRRARPDDAETVAALAAEWGYPAPTAVHAERLAALCASPAHGVFVAPSADGGLDGGLDGWIVVEARMTLGSGAFAEIAGLVVAARTRRGGVGRALVAAAEAWARDRGLRTMTVHSSIARPEAHPFYATLGYSRAKSQHVYRRALPRT